jgi:hypothetical protein
MVSVDVPSGVLADVVIVRIELLPAGIEAGLKNPDAAVGRPLTLKFAVPPKPLMTALLTVYDVLLPWPADALVGEAVIEKSCVPVTFSVTEAM